MTGPGYGDRSARSESTRQGQPSVGVALSVSAAFLAGVFFAGSRSPGDDLAAAVFLAGAAFLVAACFAGAVLATFFATSAGVTSAVFFAGVFFAGVFFAGAFFATSAG